MEPETIQNAKSSGVWGSIREWIQVIAVALLISLPIRFFIAEPFIVNGASMDPTFSTGQFLIVDRVSYRFGDPKRGDVIVFEYPNNPETYYIKRIIGLPGETLEIKSGKVYITEPGTKSTTTFELNEDYVSSSHASRDHLKVTLTSEEYFVMGDNRAQSSDSRIWGGLDRHYIVGRPIIRLFPITSFSVFPGI